MASSASKAILRAVELRAQGRILRVGHRGAAALAPENTLRSLELAVELGCDLVEFDVLDLADGTLVLAHSDDLQEVSHGAASGGVRRLRLQELRELVPELPTLDDALAFMNEHAPATGLHVDVKARSREEAIVDALSRHGVVDRAVVATSDLGSLRAFGRLEPGLARGLTYPRARLGWGEHLPAPFPRLGAALLRVGLQRRLRTLLPRVEAGAAMLQHGVVSNAVVESVHSLECSVFAWTVDDSALLERMVEAGVDGVITNDPRIFRDTL
jgi:glycerophosphoryl diester phosphodiesterase